MGVRSESQLYSSVHDSQRSFRSLDIPERPQVSPPPGAVEGTREQPIAIPDESDTSQPCPRTEAIRPGKRDFETFNESQESRASGEPGDSRESERVSWARMEAYEAMMRNLLGRGEGGWEGIALISTGGHSGVEDELAERTGG